MTLIRQDNRRSNNTSFAELIPPKKITLPSGQTRYIYHKKQKEQTDEIINKTIQKREIEEKYQPITGENQTE